MLRTVFPKHGQRGHTLLVTMAAATILIGMSGVAMLRTTATTRMSARATYYSSSERAVDGALEYAYGVWKAAIVQKDAPLLKTVTSDNTVLTQAGPAIPGFTYTKALSIDPVDAYGNVADTPTRILTYLPDYPGWRGFTNNYIATVRMQSTGGPLTTQPVAAGAKRFFQYVEVPLFQAMYFYEDTLEIYRPAPMIVAGLVHSNGRMMISGMKDNSIVDLEMTSNVSYAGGSSTVAGYTTTEPPLGGPAWAGFTVAEAPGNMESPTYSGGGESAQLSKVERYEPFGKQPSAVINTTDTNPNNDSFRELIEPAVSTSVDPPEIAKRRVNKKAGIIISINGSTTTVTAQNGTTLTTAQTNAIKAAATAKATIYDQREGKNVDVTTLDVGALTTQLNAATSFNGVLYVEDVTPLTTGNTEPKTIRLKNGGVLPNTGLTIGSQNPVYVQGDYNTGTTTSSTAVPANSTGNPNNTDSPVVSGYSRKPAAILADAVMLLSNSWSDTNASATVTSRKASNTTYNMAIMAGVMPSGYDPDGSGSAAAYGYSGGANNFPRFLEDWTSKSCTYFGSMVEVFQSKIFTGEWDTGVIYRPPNRRWNFDNNFTTNPPPGSIDVVAISRGGWANY